jgi:hypothetical protein
MRIGQRRQQRRGPQYVSHPIELDDQDALCDLLIVVASAKDTCRLMPYARTIAEKKSAIESDLTLCAERLAVSSTSWTLVHASASLSSSSSQIVWPMVICIS